MAKPPYIILSHDHYSLPQRYSRRAKSRSADGFEYPCRFLAPIEIWHRDAEHWKDLYQKGMRVLVEGRAIRDEWEDVEENKRVAFKIETRRIGILPYRVESVVLRAKPASSETGARA